MDLRPYIKTNKHLSKGIELIKKNFLLYQPYILQDTLEVGEGQNIADRYAHSKSILDFNVYAEKVDLGERRTAPDKNYFHTCNANYRALYDFVSNNIYELNGKDISNLSFAEIGCNTGLNLFNLAVKGAEKCIGYDWNNMSPVFNWLNTILDTNVQFAQGTWDNLNHKFKPINVPEVDIMINTVFTNHQCDPLQFISYICDRAKKGVFLWALINNNKNASVEYANVGHLFEHGSPFPLNFNNGISLSRNMIEITFKALGFTDIVELHPKLDDEKWDYVTQGFAMYYARRTSDVKSAYWKK